jgi:hypothetical protein
VQRHTRNLNGTHQLLVYTNGVKILCESAHTIKENKETFVVASKQIGLEVNADKTKYTVMSRDQNVGRRHNIKTDNSSFERVKQFKHLGTILQTKILFRKKLRAYRRQGMLAIIRSRIFCVPVCHPKI